MSPNSDIKRLYNTTVKKLSDRLDNDSDFSMCPFIHPSVEPVQKIACYYGTWARYSGLKADMIDANLCTSILISFVQVRDDLIDIRPFEPDDLSNV